LPQTSSKPVPVCRYDAPEQEKGKGYAKVIPEMVQSAAARVKDAVESAVGLGPQDKYEEASRQLRHDVEGIREGVGVGARDLGGRVKK
jgi:hypothetical protein